MKSSLIRVRSCGRLAFGLGALAMSAGVAFAAEPPAAPIDRGAEALNRLRERDPQAALDHYRGAWRKADRSEAVPGEAIPELRPHEPARLLSPRPAVNVTRTQERQERPGELDLGVDLEGLGLEDLNLPDELRVNPPGSGLGGAEPP
ncbi:MAG: hypothetical protein AAF907_15945, partial [Planctomycetota bacterium]